MAKATAPVPGPETHNAVVANSEPERDQDGFVAQPVANKSVSGPFLRGYSDIGTTREVTRQDFESVGIVQETLVFDWLKGYKIPLEGINPDAVDYLVKNEYGFSVVDE